MSKPAGDRITDGLSKLLPPEPDPHRVMPPKKHHWGWPRSTRERRALDAMRRRPAEKPPI